MTGERASARGTADVAQKRIAHSAFSIQHSAFSIWQYDSSPMRWSVFGLGAFFVLLHGLVLPPHGFFSGDQGAKFLQARAFAERGPFHPVGGAQTQVGEGTWAYATRPDVAQAYGGFPHVDRAEWNYELPVDVEGQRSELGARTVRLPQ